LFLPRFRGSNCFGMSRFLKFVPVGPLSILAKARLVNSKKEIIKLDLRIGNLFEVHSLDQFIPAISSPFASNLVTKTLENEIGRLKKSIKPLFLKITKRKPKKGYAILGLELNCQEGKNNLFYFLVKKTLNILLKIQNKNNEKKSMFAIGTEMKGPDEMVLVTAPLVFLTVAHDILYFFKLMTHRGLRIGGNLRRKSKRILILVNIKF
jgi:hypothetical protein